MAWKVQHLAEHGVVQVTAQGLHDRAMLRDLTRDAVVAGHQHGCARFLIDHRLTRLALGAAEIFDMPKRGEDAGFGNHLRIAILIEPDGPTRADFEFYAVQCGNLGIHFMRLFFNRDQAMEWLKADRKPRPTGL